MLYYQSKTSTFVLLSPHFISRTGKLGNPCFLSLTALLVVVEQKRALVANVCSVVIEGGIFLPPYPSLVQSSPQLSSSEDGSAAFSHPVTINEL